MSSWMEVDLTAVPTDNDVLPEGQYFNFELLPGAKPSRYDPDRVECAAKVIDGEFAGRVKYFSYGDPAKVGDWIRSVFIRFTRAVGVEIKKDEHPVDYLNRVAGSKFAAPVKHRQVDVDGVETIKDEIKIGSIRAVRQ